VQHSWTGRADILTEEEMQSVCLKSSSVQVPTGTPMLSDSATEVVSWHMFELSGKLLLP
jgi:hypothetical protein